MKKGFLILTIIAIMMISATLTGFADNHGGDKTISNKKVEEIQETINMDRSFVNKPKDFLLSTTSDTVVISGDGKENDKIIIKLYKKAGDEFVQMGDQISLNIGALGVFTKEISLKDIESSAPKEAAVSKETLVVLELRRGEKSAYDYRLIKFSDNNEVKATLKTLKLY